MKSNESRDSSQWRAAFSEARGRLGQAGDAMVRAAQASGDEDIQDLVRAISKLSAKCSRVAKRLDKGTLNAMGGASAVDGAAGALGMYYEDVDRPWPRIVQDRTDEQMVMQFKEECLKRIEDALEYAGEGHDKWNKAKLWKVIAKNCDLAAKQCRDNSEAVEFRQKRVKKDPPEADELEVTEKRGPRWDDDMPPMPTWHKGTVATLQQKADAIEKRLNEAYQVMKTSYDHIAKDQATHDDYDKMDGQMMGLIRFNREFEAFVKEVESYAGQPDCPTDQLEPVAVQYREVYDEFDDLASHYYGEGDEMDILDTVETLRRIRDGFESIELPPPDEA